MTERDRLTITREVECYNGDKVSVYFIPDCAYRPMSAFHNAQGYMIAYIDNVEICKMKIDSVFKALDELSVITPKDCHHADMVIEGLLSLLSGRHTKYNLYN